jgi:endonuclease/exonuclease/phosphatase (EEP) superfamily protein YafD
LLGFAGEQYWLLDLCSHFRVQYLVFSLILFAYTLFKGKRASAFFFIVTTIINAVCTLSIYWGRSESKNTDKVNEISAVLFNINSKNEEYSKIINYIEEKSPDLLGLLELNAKASVQLSSRLKNLGYITQVTKPREDSFGVGLYSKIKLDSFEIKSFGGNALPSIEAELILSKNKLRVILTHPLPPVSKSHSASRNNQLDSLSEYIRSLDKENILVMGDLNATPWSFVFKKLLNKSSLRDSRQGFGLQPTWPRGTVSVLIPIDHLLVSPEIHVIDREVGRDLGSDHYPIFMKFQLSR